MEHKNRLAEPADRSDADNGQGGPVGRIDLLTVASLAQKAATRCTLTRLHNGGLPNVARLDAHTLRRFHSSGAHGCLECKPDGIVHLDSSPTEPLSDLRTFAFDRPARLGQCRFDIDFNGCAEEVFKQTRRLRLLLGFEIATQF